MSNNKPQFGTVFLYLLLETHVDNVIIHEIDL